MQSQWRVSTTSSVLGLFNTVVELLAQRLGYKGEVHRASFIREVSEERDARSVLTMLAQVSWERDRQYRPVMPITPERQAV